jgi:hypothetical protein
MVIYFIQHFIHMCEEFPQDVNQKYTVHARPVILVYSYFSSCGSPGEVL